MAYRTNWLKKVLEADALYIGKPVYRDSRDVEKYASEKQLIDACVELGFILWKTETCYVIFPTTHFEILVGPNVNSPMVR